MKTYMVGGAVRDTYMGKTPLDRDFVVVGGSPQAMLAMGYEQVGAAFPVFLHPVSGDEYALARTERKTGKAMLVHLGVPEVSRDYLRELGYIRPIMSGSSGSGLFGP